MQPYPETLLAAAGIETPLVGFYDAPDPKPFEPYVSPPEGSRPCLFAYYRKWLAGEFLRLTEDQAGCGGAGYWVCGQEGRPRKDFVRFLVDDEGLKATHELMNQWLDVSRPYAKEHGSLFVGPLRAAAYEHLKTITFFVNPDQMSLLMLAAQYRSAPNDPPPVLAPFGSGCSLLVAPFEDLTQPQAALGATDIAMRQYLPPDILAFTVTKPMFEQLCTLDEQSFLHKPFWRNLQKARSRGREE